MPSHRRTYHRRSQALRLSLLTALAAAPACSSDATATPTPAAAAQAPQDPTPVAPGAYDFARPLRTFDLPPSLQEISAVTAFDEETVACLQDEKGIVFLVDVRNGRLRSARPFGPDGDYEGLTRVGDDYWVLRSDGLLARVGPRGGGLGILETFVIDTPNQDFEGLCHDPARGALLVAPKDVVKPPPGERKRTKGDRKRGGKDEKDSEAELSGKPRDQRVVFGWDMEKRTLLAEPVLRLSLDDLIRRAEKRGDELPTRTNRRGKERTVLRLLFSCVAVRPGTGEVYLLSAADHVLLVVDRQGTLRDLHLLDETALPKPEGLTFLANGDLVLSSEGVEGPARLVVYRAKAQ